MRGGGQRRTARLEAWGDGGVVFKRGDEGGERDARQDEARRRAAVNRSMGLRSVVSARLAGVST